MEKFKKHLREYWSFYVITVLAVVLYSLVVYPLSAQRPIDYDSSYQAALMRHSLKGIWQLIPTDFSPPLYAFFLKPFAVLFGFYQEGLRLSTAVIYIGMMPVCFFPLRRAFGKKTAILTALAFLFSTANHWIFIDFRPHVLGYFLTTIAFVYAILVYKTGSKKDYVLFTIYSVLAMYTHTVAMFSALGFYVALILCFYLKRNFKAIKNVFISGIICSVCYIPWLVVLYNQFKTMRSNYWSSFINFGKMIHAFCLLHFYDFRNDYEVAIPMAVFLVVILCLSIYAFVNGIKAKKDVSLFVTALLLFLVPVFIFVFINIFVAEIYVDRYVYNFAGMCLVLISVAVSRIKIPKIDLKSYVMIAFAVVLAVNFAVASQNYKKQLDSNNFMQLIERIKEEGGDNIAFVHANEWDLGIMMYYFPDAHHYVTSDMYTVLTTYDVFPSEVIDIGDPDNISQYEDTFFVCATDLSTQKWSPVRYYFDSEDYELVLFKDTYTGSYYGFNIRYAEVKVN